MARTPKPWWREDRQAFFVTIRSERHNLGPDKDEAFRRYYALMAKPPERHTQADSPSLAVLFDRFLSWCQKHRVPRMYAGHRWHLQRFVDHLGDTAHQPALDIRPHHVMAWVDAHPERRVQGIQLFDPLRQKRVRFPVSVFNHLCTPLFVKDAAAAVHPPRPTGSDAAGPKAPRTAGRGTPATLRAAAHPGTCPKRHRRASSSNRGRCGGVSCSFPP